MTAPPARPGRAGVLIVVLALAALVLSAALIRVVQVEGSAGPGLVWLWAWQGGRVEFINSVTSRPVLITFKTPWRFSDFQAQTDPGTEEYYTEGTFSWNQRLAQESTRRLNYCSEVGLTLHLGSRVFRQQGGGCVQAQMVWPP